MKLSIIIVSWNVKDRLRENLQALLASKADFDFEVFVVDNNSEDDSAAMVRSEFPRVHLIENEANFGFAKANNQVIRQANTEYVLLLNPDMRLRPDTLNNMVGWMDKNQQAAVAGCRLLDEQGYVIKQVRRFPGVWDQLAIVLKLPHLFKNILKRYIIEDFDYSRAQVVDSIRGAFFMINKRAVCDLKLSRDITLPQLDERYFLWFEEVDYCRQIRKAGGEVWFTPAAECIDLVGKSFEQVSISSRQKFIRDSMLKYFQKWHRPWECWVIRSAWPISQALVKISMLLKIKSRAKT